MNSDAGAPIRPTQKQALLERSSRRASRLAAMSGFALVLLMSGFVVLPQAFAAQPPLSCDGWRHNVEGEQYDPNKNDQTGIFSDLRFAPGNDDCIRVSSIAVIRGNEGVVEWGWGLGWAPNYGNVYKGPGACNNQYFTDPELFVTWVPEGGANHCQNILRVSTPSADFHTMSVLDGDGDTTFGAWYEGSQKASVDVNFSSGVIVTNGELHNSSDSAYSHFEDLRYRTVNNRGSWTSFTLSECHMDNAGDWYWVANSNTDTEVQSGSGSC